VTYLHCSQMVGYARLTEVLEGLSEGRAPNRRAKAA
jgi:hypothetical protein